MATFYAHPIIAAVALTLLAGLIASLIVGRTWFR